MTKNTFKVKNLLTRIPTQIGPLAALKTCLDKKIRIKVNIYNFFFCYYCIRILDVLIAFLLFEGAEIKTY